MAFGVLYLFAIGRGRSRHGIIASLGVDKGIKYSRIITDWTVKNTLPTRLAFGPRVGFKIYGRSRKPRPCQTEARPSLRLH